MYTGSSCRCLASSDRLVLSVVVAVVVVFLSSLFDDDDGDDDDEDGGCVDVPAGLGRLDCCER